VDFGFPNFFHWSPYDRLISLTPGKAPIYKKNKSVKMTQPFGNLRALANNYHPDDGHVLEYEPRDIAFKTDSLGFRNDSDYRGQPYILVGDSFVAGTANTQEHTLSSVLKNSYQADTYSLAVEGANISNYVTYIKMFENLNNGPFKVIIFLYESNDFPSAEVENISEPKKLKHFYKKPINLYKSFFRETGLYRYTWIAYKSIRRSYRKSTFSRLQINQIGNHLIGFARGEVRDFEREYTPHPDLEKNLKSIRNRIEHMYYIPSKYRAYHPLLNNRDKELPIDTTWKGLFLTASRLKIPATNLTPVFIKEAKKYYLEKSQFIYWKDDTHWNINGITIAAKVICQTVKKLGCNDNN